MTASKFPNLKPSGELTYLLVVNGKPEGPYTIEELKEKKIKPADFVRTTEMDDYKEAHEVAELREIFGFAKQRLAPQYFAGFDQRLLAAAIDWLMLFGLFISIMLICLLLTTDQSARLIAAFALLALFPVARLIYSIVMESSVKQATYGKILLKIKVTDMKGERISPGKAIGRNLAKILSLLTLFVGYLFSFFNRQQQCLHDMVAETLVIKDRLI